MPPRELTLHETQQIAEMIGPAIRESMRDDLTAMKEDIKSSVRESCEQTTKAINDHNERLTAVEKNQSRLLVVSTAICGVGSVIGGAALQATQAWLTRKTKG